MESEDLKSLAQIGHSLWSDSESGRNWSVETLCIVTMKDLTVSRAVERTSQALLHRARSGEKLQANAFKDPFYLLSPEERFVLCSLHVNHWSYERIARILEQTKDQVAELAWAARLHLVSMPGQSVSAPHPTGSGFEGVACPEYHPRKPWTQNFLDDELKGLEKIFIQDHVAVCKSCSSALARCRQFYYAVDRMTPRIAQTDEAVKILGRSLLRSRALKDPSQLSFVDTLVIFTGRSDVRWIGVGILLLFFSTLF